MSDRIPLTAEEVVASIFDEPMTDAEAAETLEDVRIAAGIEAVLAESREPKTSQEGDAVDEWDAWLAQDAPERAIIQNELEASLAGVTSTHLRPDTVEYFQGHVPFQAWGATAEGSWYFRFRGDNATLCLGPGQEDGRYTPDELTTFSAARRAVTGDWRAGSLGRDRAIELIVELWKALAPGPAA